MIKPQQAAATSPPEGARPKAPAGPPARPEQGLVRFFAASGRNLWPRIASALAVAIGMSPFLPVAWVGLWLMVVIAMPVLALREIRAAETDPGRKASLALNLQINAVASGVLHAGAALVLWFAHSPAAALFAVCACWVSIVYVLMQYYARPGLFAVVVSPYLVALAAMAVDAGLRAAEARRGVYLVTLIAGAVLIGNFIVVARRQLAASRAQLRQARALANEREKAADEASRAKSAFVATISHEIRTPLNGVLGMTQALAAEKLTGRQRAHVEVIRKSGEALLAILNDVLDLSKIEAGKLELEAIAFDLGEVLRGAHDAFAAMAKSKSLAFPLMVGPDVEGLYLGDPTRVRQILNNLVSNAVKFTQAGGVRIEATRTAAGVRLAVCDTGPGIAPEQVPELFGKFAQADATITRRFGGTGLGLSISRELAQLMGGEIEVESEAGQGSRFTAVLPLERVGESVAAAAAPPPPPPSAPAKGRPFRVLAAEDNSVNQVVLKTLLAQIGIEPEMAQDGVQAVEAWEAQAWDVILMDVQMPRMDGLAATRAIREREAASGRRRTPVIALTAEAMAHQVSQYAAAGIDAHVVKPIDARRLFEALEAALSQHAGDNVEAA